MDSNDASDGGIPRLVGVTRPSAGRGTWRHGRRTWRLFLPATLLLAGLWGCGGGGSQATGVSQEQLQATRALRQVGATIRIDDQGRPIAVSLKNVELSDATLQALGQLESLQALDASRTGLTDEQLAQLENLTQLKSLNLARCPITSDGLKHLAPMTQLENLWLSRSKVRDAGLAHLAGLSQLKQLRISRTRVGDKGLKHLESLSNLEMVQLRNTRVTDRGVAALKEALPEAQ
ncbi:MAG: leucine-rich repeat domain-containing protein, partial [Pirellulales bacterium]